MEFPANRFIDNFLHLFYPHNCEGCGTDILNDAHFICARCLHQLPDTQFFLMPANPVEKIFYGRIPVTVGAAAFYFTKHSLIQHLMVQLKYKGNKEAGLFLGRMMGHLLKKAERFQDIDCLVPLPLNEKKEHARGYNQALVICRGITEIWHKPIEENCVIRQKFTETQTHQNRSSRWQNMEAVFSVTDISRLQNKHILLIDDVITTGATLEACGEALLTVDGLRLGIAAAAYTV